MKKILLLGSGGHSKSCIDLIESDKNFELSDQIRDDLLKIGVQLNDDKNESSYKMI